METKLLTGEPGILEAIDLLKDGQCVALPTETVYGLAADAGDEAAVASIFTAKGRPSDHPVIVHLGSNSEVQNWAQDVPDSVARLAEAFWPGPLTLLLRRANHVSKVITGGHETIAVRIPDQPIFLRVLKDSGLALAAPSANRYKKLSPTSAEQVIKGMDGRIAGVVEGGSCDYGLESTILSLAADQPTIVRSGPIGRAALEDVLGCEVLAPKQHNVAVPGNVGAHYQPNAKLRLVSPVDLIAQSAGNDNACMVCASTTNQALLDAGVDEDRILFLGEDPSAYGHDLYSSLYRFDQAGFTEVLIETTPISEDWAAINDRLSRATSG